jgi:hypothetical protein
MHGYFTCIPKALGLTEELTNDWTCGPAYGKTEA